MIAVIDEIVPKWVAKTLELYWEILVEVECESEEFFEGWVRSSRHGAAMCKRLELLYNVTSNDY